jgi:threonine/homoserine/homoserine lactone efflux protein
MEEKQFPRWAALAVPLGVVAFVVGGVSTLGEVLLHSPRVLTPVVALSFALLVTFGAAYLSWREGKRMESPSPSQSSPTRTEH